MNIRALCISTLTVATLTAGVSSASAAGANGSPASSSVQPQSIGPGGENCVDGDGSLCLYFSANGTGARTPIFGAVSCYDSCGDTNWTFTDPAEGTAGLDHAVRNATHYAYNNDSSDGYAIFVDPNYGGATDELCADGSWSCSYVVIPPETGEDAWHDNLGPTQNNNASQEYLSTLANSL